jgi:hypothetical protein
MLYPMGGLDLVSDAGDGRRLEGFDDSSGGRKNRCGYLSFSLSHSDSRSEIKRQRGFVPVIPHLLRKVSGPNAISPRASVMNPGKWKAP